MKTCPAQEGDYLEFFAETDLLCALSTCPGGDLSKAMWGEGSEVIAEGTDPTLECCRPLGVDVYDLVKREELLEGWSEARPRGEAYKGAHGLRAKEWGA